GATIITLHPSRYWFYPSVHLVGFVDFLVALAAFDFFVRQVIAFRARLVLPDGRRLVSNGSLTVAAYAAFAVLIVFLLNLRLPTPDMLVAAAIFTASGLLLAMSSHGWTSRRGVATGVVLAIGYFAKTVMFPVGMLYVLCMLALASTHAARRAAAAA